MRIFHRERNQAARMDEVTRIRERVQTMREQMGHREVQLTDLFAMLSEDERKIYWTPGEGQDQA